MDTSLQISLRAADAINGPEVIEFALQRRVTPVPVANTREPLDACGRVIDLRTGKSERRRVSVVPSPRVLSDAGKALLGRGTHRLDDRRPRFWGDGRTNSCEADEIIDRCCCEPGPFAL